MAWGTVQSMGANVVWYGDLVVDRVTERVKTGLFSSTEVTKYFRYFLGAQMAICRGEVDALTEVRHDGKVPTQTITDATERWDVEVSDDDLFGDAEQEGGVAGTINVYKGTSDQTPNDYLQEVLEQPLPAYLDTCHAVFRAYYWGNSNYIKPISFVVRRTPASIPGMDAADANINGDANAACILYEMLTDPACLLGLPAAQIDLASFRAVAATLKDEDLGLSFLLDTPAEAAAAIDDVLRHIDGVLYTDPATGLVTLALARDDYTPAALPVFDTSNVLTCELSRIGWPDTKNIVKVKYLDRAENYTERIAQHQDLGNIQARGGEIAAETIEFKGASRAAVASRLAARALKALSYPLANVHLSTNRDAWTLRPGSCFVINWSPLGIANAVYRVTRINYGELLDGKIDLDAVEDIFAVTGDAFTTPGGTAWVDPNQPVGVAAEAALFELPYQAAEGESRIVGALAGRATGQEYQYEIWTDPAGGTDYLHTGDGPAFAPYGYLVSSLDHITAAVTSLVIRGGRDLQNLADCTDAELESGKNIMLVGDEFMAWKTIAANGDGTYTLGTVWRAVLDTVPEGHNAGTPVLFLAAGVGLTSAAAYPADITLKAKLLPKTYRETLPIASAAQLSLVTASRAWKPLPPGLIRLNSALTLDTVTGDAVMTWAHRNRIAQATAQRIYTQDEASISGGPEGNYTVETLIDGTVIDTATGISATTHTYAAADRETDDADGTLPVILQVRGVAAGYSSAANATDPFIMTGAGMTLGLYLGGIQS